MSHIKGRNKYTLYRALIRRRWRWLGLIPNSGTRWMSWLEGLRLMKTIREEEARLYGHE